MIWKIAIKNLIHKKLNTLLSVSLLAFSVGIIGLLLLMQDTIEQKFQNDLKDIDMVIGAKGSPLQLVLSAVYHMDSPTGNIKIAEAKKFVNSGAVEQAIPLAYGDSYSGYRVLGTTPDYLKKYDASFSQGQVFTASMEAVIGHDVANSTGLKVGDEFYGVHGEVDNGHTHDEHGYKVVGILNKNNSVLDYLLMSNVESVWQVHDIHGPVVASQPDTLANQKVGFDHDHSHHEHDHDHDHGREHPGLPADSMEVTAYLLKFRSKMALLNFPRIINGETTMQAALPGMEINRLFHMLGIGANTLKMIGGAIMLMSGLSVFFALFSQLGDRKYELALLRASGYRPFQLFTLLIIEGLLLAMMGFALGVALSRLGIYILNNGAAERFNLHFGMAWTSSETWLLLITIAVGVVSAFIPALRAMRVDVATSLSEA